MRSIFPTLLYTSTREIPTFFVYTWSMEPPRIGRYSKYPLPPSLTKKAPSSQKNQDVREFFVFEDSKAKETLCAKKATLLGVTKFFLANRTNWKDGRQ